MLQDTIFKEVTDFFDAFVPTLPQGKSVCVAVSGGSDSVALFFILLALRSRLGITRLGIAHVNHRLRGEESDADAGLVKAISLKAKAPFHEKLLGPPPKAGMEEWARRERYGFFGELCRAEGYDYLATGHTADDQAETVVMRIMRGCGLKGLCAIAPVREDGVIRPLLRISKQSLCDWLLETQTEFREDSSNSDIAFRRNMVRHRTIPALAAGEPQLREQLLRIARSAGAAWQLLSIAINKWIEANVMVENERFEICTSEFDHFPFIHDAVAQVLRQRRISFERHHVEAIVHHAIRKNGVFLLPGGWRYRCRPERIEFYQGIAGKKADSSQWRHEVTLDSSLTCTAAGVIIENCVLPAIAGKPLRYSDNNMTVFLDAGACENSLEFRCLKREDVFQPLGCDQKRNAKEFLKKRKKSDWVAGVVAKRNGEIVWIPGVEIGHAFRVTSHTSAILKFSCKYIK